MDRIDEIKEEIAEVNPEALFADGFEGALLGYVQRFGMAPVPLYDCEKCIQILVARDGMERDEAAEYFEFNVLGAWMGEGTPAFAVLFDSTP